MESNIISFSAAVAKKKQAECMQYLNKNGHKPVLTKETAVAILDLDEKMQTN